MKPLWATDILAILIAVTACGPQQEPVAKSPSTPTREPICSSERDVLQQGLHLEKAGKKAEALALYRPCLPQLLHRVYMLGKCYAPARTELQAYRDKIETSLRAGRTTSNDQISNLASINSLYNEERRSTQLYRELLAAHRSPAQVTELHTWIWEDLVAERAYAEALGFEDHLASSTSSIGFHPEMDHRTIQNAAIYYEALLGVGRTQDAANKLMQLIERIHDPEIIKIGHIAEGAYDIELFSEFLKHACLVNDAAAIADVLAKASQYLNAEAMEKLRGTCATSAAP